MSFTEREQIDCLRLIRTERVGPVTFRKLIARYGSASAALEALPTLARGGGAKPLQPASADAATAELDSARAVDAVPIFLGTTNYPAMLQEIEDAPPIVYVKGELGLLNKPTIGIVGTRNASINGLRIAGQLAEALGDAGFIIASGMARGIDGAAHDASLVTGTIAVLAGGADIVYPKEHQGLYQRIVADGTVISEMPPGIVPQARHFPRRNRMISGLSLGIVVVEAAKRSGSLITARMALEQNREVFAVPGSPLDPRAQGPNHLIREGAVLTETADDITNILSSVAHGLTGPPQPFETTNKNDPQPNDAEVDESRKVVQNLLGPTPVAVDELIRQCQMSPAAVTTVLLELELAGRLERHPGNLVALLAET